MCSFVLSCTKTFRDVCLWMCRTSWNQRSFAWLPPASRASLGPCSSWTVILAEVPPHCRVGWILLWTLILAFKLFGWGSGPVPVHVPRISQQRCVYWQKPFLKGQILDKHWKTFIGNESGIYNCKYSHQNLSIWVMLMGSGYTSPRNSGSVHTSVRIRRVRGSAWTANTQSSLLSPVIQSHFLTQALHRLMKSIFFFVQRLFLKCISLPGGHLCHPWPLGRLLWTPLRALDPAAGAGLLPCGSACRQALRARGGVDPGRRLPESAGDRWEQSTLSRTALVGECRGLSDGMTLSPASPSPRCLCPGGSGKHL